MKIYLGSDHRGYKLKEKVKVLLTDLNIAYEDLGNSAYDQDDDYPDFALAVAQKVATEEDSLGIVTCGSGVGVTVAANKVKGVRCGLGFTEDQVRLARKDDNINILAIAADFTDHEYAKLLVKSFIESQPSDEEKYKRRIEKITNIENSK